VEFNDRTLEALAPFRPPRLRHCSVCPGIDPAKLEAYRDELIDLIGLE
jgi:hypothetical protein